MSISSDKVTIWHLVRKASHHIKEEAKVAVIRRVEVVLAHIITPIRITGNRINIIVHIQQLGVPTSTKKGQGHTQVTKAVQGNREAKIPFLLNISVIQINS